MSKILKVISKIKNVFYLIGIIKRPLKMTTSVGLLYLCTGEYEMFFDKYFKTFSRHFMPGSKKIFFVFTDSEKLKKKYKHRNNIHFIDIKHYGWPLGTLLRNRYFFENKYKFDKLDFLFFCNANLVCKEDIYLNELGISREYKLCGVQHPNFFYKKSSLFEIEKETQCNAFFTKEEIPLIKNYFQGCFYGGYHDEFIEMISTIHGWTEEDLSKGIMPIWLDESYLNKYFFLYPPFPAHPGFAYPEKILLPFSKKIVQLDKISRSSIFKHD